MKQWFKGNKKVMMSFQPAKNISKNTGNSLIHKHNNIVNKIFSSNLTVGGQRRCLYVKYT